MPKAKIVQQQSIQVGEIILASTTTDIKELAGIVLEMLKDENLKDYLIQQKVSNFHKQYTS